MRDSLRGAIAVAGVLVGGYLYTTLNPTKWRACSEWELAPAGTSRKAVATQHLNCPNDPSTPCSHPTMSPYSSLPFTGSPPQPAPL
ncbi:hypothetical protein FA95DRAFT_1553474 [Auriscalpium vulgare]|uniref:Uncharacterized protein n=1 Tax=Auriscalpium vulgare TaxID=40419 RepID=A0ACB8S950_9AGAM|nr:hypothetical protein FA95DRAFT_1553474 [Auriscalpium vulgare]